MTGREARRSAIAAAALVFAIAGPATYALSRVYEYARGENGNPVLILATLHTVYYWRVGVAVWWAGVVACVAFAVFERSPDGGRRADRIATAAAILVPLVVIAGWLFP